MLMQATEQTLSEVFIAHRPQLRRIARGLVRCAEVSEEIVQDAYLRIVAVEGTCDVIQPIGYCSRIVRNLALDHCRRRALEASYRSFDVDVEQIEVAGLASPQKSMGDQQVLRAIDGALRALPVKARMAYEMHLFKGLTQREIARDLGCSLGAVNALVNEAIDAIGACRHLLDED